MKTQTCTTFSKFTRTLTFTTFVFVCPASVHWHLVLFMHAVIEPSLVPTNEVYLRVLWSKGTSEVLKITVTTTTMLLKEHRPESLREQCTVPEVEKQLTVHYHQRKHVLTSKTGGSRRLTS